MLHRIALTAAALVVAMPAFAHPGHDMDVGFAHDLAHALVGGVVVLVGVALVATQLAGWRGRRAHRKSDSERDKR